jgi:rod shape-determining protein MreC
MWELVKKYRVAVVTGFVMLTAFLVYASNLKDREEANFFEKGALAVMSPFLGMAAGIEGGLDGFYRNYMALANVRRQNVELLEQLRLMNTRLIAEQEALTANERLKKLLELKDRVKTPTIAASIIGEDGAPWFKTLVVDRGAADGFSEGMPVLATEGVVGQVIKVSANSSRVLLITDHASAIAAVVQRSRARGVVRGAGGGRLTLEFSIKEDDVKVGDQVLTSGIGGIFPKGVPIGEVTMVKKGEYGIFQIVEVRPSVMISRLEEVLVLTRKPND